jgi:hypothetical protein
LMKITSPDEADGQPGPKTSVVAAFWSAPIKFRRVEGEPSLRFQCPNLPFQFSGMRM